MTDREAIERAIEIIRGHAKLAGFRVDLVGGGYIAVRLNWDRASKTNRDGESFHFATLKALHAFILEAQARWVCAHTGADLPEWIQAKDRAEAEARENFSQIGEHPDA